MTREEIVHKVSIFRIGWCYGLSCECGKVLNFTSANILPAVHDAVSHVEQSGSLAEADMWIFGDVSHYPEVKNGWENPVLRIVVKGKNDLEIFRKTGNLFTTLEKFVRSIP